MTFEKNSSDAAVYYDICDVLFESRPFLTLALWIVPISRQLPGDLGCSLITKAIGRFACPLCIRYAPRQQFEDHLVATPPVVGGRPSPEEFIREVHKELKIRYYQPKTIKNYRRDIVAFLKRAPTSV